LGEIEVNTILRVYFWLQNVKKNADGEKDKPVKVTFFLEDKVRLNKDETKTQYINSIGNCAWAENESDLPDWFVKRDYRTAYSGEEDLFEFMRAWLNKLDYREAETTLALNWKKLMKGDVKELREQVNGEWAGEVGCLSTIIVKDVEGESKEYQGVFNRGFFPVYTFKHFRVIDFDNEEVQEALKTKPSKDLKPYERFVLKVIGEYGCKDYYKFKDLKEYDPADNPVATDAPLTDGGSDY